MSFSSNATERFDAHSYASSRKPYGLEVDRLCVDFLGSEPLKVLDIGCGTGISTREIATIGHLVVGCDQSASLLSVAMEHPGCGTAYRRGSAESLPFYAGCFDCVTAFGSLHWFSTPQAMGEITRVLRPGGRIIAVNKNDRTQLPELVRQIVRRTSGRTPDRRKAGYEPVRLLADHGFESVSSHRYAKTETYDRIGLMDLCRSMHAWSLLGVDESVVAEHALREAVDALLIRGEFQRKLDVVAVTARWRSRPKGSSTIPGEHKKLG